MAPKSYTEISSLVLCYTQGSLLKPGRKQNKMSTSSVWMVCLFCLQVQRTDFLPEREQGVIDLGQ